MFLSRLCSQTFGQYAHAQIKKARGLNKKKLNPLDKTGKTILDFCYIVRGQGAVPVFEWLTDQGCHLPRNSELALGWFFFRISGRHSPAN